MPKRPSNLRRFLRLALLASPLGLSLVLLLWTMSANPFTRPLVDASEAQVRRSLDRALAGRVTADWLAAELETALAAEDLDRVETLVLIAGDRGLAPGPVQQARTDALVAAHSGLWEGTKTCALCMADIAACPSLSLMAGCGIPFELTPLGDANALRRASWAAWNGEEIDRLDVSLAVVGLGATAAIVVSGGSSGTLKLGAAAIRIGRRMGTLTPEFGRLLARLADVDLKPSLLLPYLRGAAPLDELVDTARLARLGEVSSDLARVASNTSLGDAVVLLRHVDSAEDAARLARVSKVAGARTRPVMDVLGKQRVFRALVRVSDLALAAAGLIYATVLQALLSVAGWVGTRTYRASVRALA